MNRRLVYSLTSLLAAMALITGACSSDDSGGGGSGDGTASDGERSVGAPAVPDDCANGEEDPTGAQAVVEERGRPDPTELIAAVGDTDEPVDLVEGEGDEVIDGGTVKIQFSIINPADGTELQTSWGPQDSEGIAAPVDVPLAQVFPVFAESVAGMKAGGRRVFTVTAGELGSTPPPESGLTTGDQVLFVVDLVSVSEDAGAPGEDGSVVKADEEALAAVEERGAPDVTVPEGDEQPEDLIVIDEVVGDGDVVCPDATVLAHYTGVDISSGEQFDSSWEGGDPIEFPLNGVIKGWTNGLVGMKVGGRRTLVIPGDQAYGDGEDTEGGQPMGDLVFTIDLVGVA